MPIYILADKLFKAYSFIFLQLRSNMEALMKRLLTLAFIITFACCAQSHAEDWPSHPIKMLTMTGPGAQIDLLTRAVAEAMKDQLGQPVLVTNMPGGSHGSVMATELAQSKPDGYTLGTSATGAFTYSPYITKTKYQPEDFTYLTLLGLNQSGIICAPDRPWKNLKDAFDWAKKEGKGLTYMFQGSDDRDAMKRIAEKEGVKLSLMPSTGGPSIITAVMGGHADIGHVGAILFDYVNGGKLKCLAATTPQRLTELKDVPTLKEQGWDEAVEMFIVLAAPKDLPKNVIERLGKVVDSLSANGDLQNFITKLKIAPVKYGLKEASKYIAETSDRNKTSLQGK